MDLHALLCIRSYHKLIGFSGRRHRPPFPTLPMARILAGVSIVSRIPALYRLIRHIKSHYSR
jgi:hypothetical protein